MTAGQCSRSLLHFLRGNLSALFLQLPMPSWSGNDPSITLFILLCTTHTLLYGMLWMLGNLDSLLLRVWSVSALSLLSSATLRSRFLGGLALLAFVGGVALRLGFYLTV